MACIAMSGISERLTLYLRLIRFDRPIGTFLLLWPTWWGLWLAGGGNPSLKNLLIFTCGVFLMRSAGCIVNDIADRNIDAHVERTRERPLARGLLGVREALLFGAALTLLAFVLVLMTNRETILLSVAGLGLASTYPFLKRHTHLPQVALGLAFSWGIPMAFAAETGALPPALWLVFCAAATWTIVYDTFYAMVDRDDDLKIGVKSTAILFGDADRAITAVLQLLVIWLLFLTGRQFDLGLSYYSALAAGALLFGYQQWLIRRRERAGCFRAFLNNNLFGLVIFAGIAADFAVS